MELISREEAVSILQDMYDRVDSIHESTDGDDWAWEEMKALQFAINTIEERKEGEWLSVKLIDDDSDFSEVDGVRCSVCGETYDEYWATTYFHYCPTCGAKMKGE